MFCVQIVDGDVTGVNIIAFRRLSQMDISGNIIGNSSMEHISTVKVIDCIVFIDAVMCTFVHCCNIVMSVTCRH